LGEWMAWESRHTRNVPHHRVQHKMVDPAV
jgi:hypothetical protein